MPAPYHQITLAETGARFSCPADERVLIAMERQGLRLLPVGCRGGGCGICRVRVTHGRYHTRKMSRAHVSEADEAAGIVLACRLIPETDLSLRLESKPENDGRRAELWR